MLLLHAASSTQSKPRSAPHTEDAAPHCCFVLTHRKLPLFAPEGPGQLAGPCWNLNWTYFTAALPTSPHRPMSLFSKVQTWWWVQSTSKTMILPSESRNATSSNYFHMNPGENLGVDPWPSKTWELSSQFGCFQTSRNAFFDLQTWATVFRGQPCRSMESREKLLLSKMSSHQKRN